jgi:hypothetical protein
MTLLTVRMSDRIFPPLQAAALSFNEISRTQDTDLTSSNDRLNGPEMDGKASGRKMLSKAQWEELRPIIRSLYWDQRYTLNRLAEYLHEHYGFKPT